MLLAAQCRRGRARYGPNRHKVPALECRKLPLQLAYSFSFPLAQVRPSSLTPRDEEKRLACAALPATGNATLFSFRCHLRPPTSHELSEPSIFIYAVFHHVCSGPDSSHRDRCSPGGSRFVSLRFWERPGDGLTGTDRDASSLSRYR